MVKGDGDRDGTLKIKVRSPLGWPHGASVLAAVQAGPASPVPAERAAWTASARAAVGLGMPARERARKEAPTWHCRSASSAFNSSRRFNR
jgi:hypothetical protein